MSAAAAPTLDAGADRPAKKGKKKLIVIAAAVLVALLLAGGGAAMYLKKQAASAAEAADALEEDGGAAGVAAAAKPDLKHPPIFLPLDPFVVNLSDKEADRYAQIGITLEVEDAKFAEQMKAFMPAIRNGILMILAHKSSRELLERSGKEQLAEQVLREASRTMGIEVAPAAADAASAPDGDADEAPTTSKAKAKARAKAKAGTAHAEPNPIRRVHFSNFIIQ